MKRDKKSKAISKRSITFVVVSVVLLLSFVLVACDALGFGREPDPGDNPPDTTVTKYTFSVNASTNGSATDTRGGYVDTEKTTVNGQYAAGTTVTLVGVKNDGYNLYWMVNGTKQSQSSTFTYTMTEKNCIVIASFEGIEYDLMVKSNNTSLGNIGVAEGKIGRMQCGTKVRVLCSEVNADTVEFLGWAEEKDVAAVLAGTKEPLATTYSYEFDMGPGDFTLVAVFKAK